MGEFDEFKDINKKKKKSINDIKSIKVKPDNVKKTYEEPITFENDDEYKQLSESKQKSPRFDCRIRSNASDMRNLVNNSINLAKINDKNLSELKYVDFYEFALTFLCEYRIFDLYKTPINKKTNLSKEEVIKHIQNLK